MRGARALRDAGVARSTLHGGSSSSGRDAVDEHGRGAVRGHEVHRRSTRIAGYGSCAGEQPVDGVAHRLHLGRVEVGRVERRREARRDQQRVALAQRHVEVIGEVQHHLAARPGPAGLDEAQVPRRDAGVVRQIELAQAPPRPPVAQQRADGGRSLMRPHRTDGSRARPLPPRESTGRERSNSQGANGDAVNVSGAAARAPICAAVATVVSGARNVMCRVRGERRRRAHGRVRVRDVLVHRRTARAVLERVRRCIGPRRACCRRRSTAGCSR